MVHGTQVDDTDLRIKRNRHWKQTAAIRIGSQVGEYVEIKKGVRQGRVLSPDPFNLYSERTLRELEDMPGLVVGGNNINSSVSNIGGTTSRISSLRNAKNGICVNTSEAKSMIIIKRRISQHVTSGLILQK